jgi:hypothetical protein
MKRQIQSTQVVAVMVKVGETYRSRDGGLVVVEDHEYVGGRRTGRFLVCTAGGPLPAWRRWYCGPGDLTDIAPAGGGCSVRSLGARS